MIKRPNRKNNNKMRQVSLILASVSISTIVAFAILGSIVEDVSANEAVAGKITFLPWNGTESGIVLLPPAQNGLETTANLPLAIVNSGLTYA